MVSSVAQVSTLGPGSTTKKLNMWHMLVGRNSKMFKNRQSTNRVLLQNASFSICTLVWGQTSDLSEALLHSPDFYLILHINVVRPCKVLLEQVGYFSFSDSFEDIFLCPLVIWMYICNTFGDFLTHPFLRKKTLTLQLFSFQKELCSFISQTEKAYLKYIIS